MTCLNSFPPNDFFSAFLNPILMTPLRHIPSNRNDPYFNHVFNTLEMIFYNTVYIVYYTKDTRSKLVSIKMGISAPWLLFRSGYFSGKQRVLYSTRSTLAGPSGCHPTNLKERLLTGTAAARREAEW